MRYIIHGTILGLLLPWTAWGQDIQHLPENNRELALSGEDIPQLDLSDDEMLMLDAVENTASFERETTDTENFDDRVMHAETVTVSKNSPGHELGEILSSAVASHISDHGSRLQRKGVAFRGAGSQDIVVRYEGIVMNALSDASADLGMIPAQLLKSASFWATGAGAVSGAGGGMIDLKGNDNVTPIRAVLTGGTLGDFDLFVSGGHQATWGMIGGAAFGDYSSGQFSYIDTQGSHQIREHNAAHRIGCQLRAEIDTPVGHISGLTFFSAVDRQEAGLSEYPARYARATQAHWLSLSRASMTFDPLMIGQAVTVFQMELTHRASRDIYDNPTSFIGSTPTHSDYLENRTMVSANASFIAGDWSQTQITFVYDAQDVSAFHWAFHQPKMHDYQRHLLGIGVGEQVTFWHDSLKAGLHLRMETNFDALPMFEASLGIAGKPLSWLEIWGSAALAERRPSFDELYYETEYIRGNPALRNQQSLLGEIGVSLYPASWLNLKVSGFYHHHTDLIRFIPITPYLYQARNITDASSRGLEVTLRSQFWRGFALEGRYAWVNAVTGSGFPMPTTPEHHIQAALSWDEAIWHAKFCVDYATKMPRNMTGTLFSSPKLRLNLELGMEIYTGWRIDFVLNNLLDDREAQDVLQRPLPGRHAFISLSYALEPSSQ